jgi:hypothetical protein
MCSYDILRVYENYKTLTYTYKQYLLMTDASYRFQKHKMISFYPPYYLCKGDIKGGRVNFIKWDFGHLHQMCPIGPILKVYGLRQSPLDF